MSQQYGDQRPQAQEQRPDDDIPFVSLDPDLILEEVARLAARIAADWRAIALASQRGDLRAVGIELNQVIVATRTVRDLVAELAQQEQLQDTTEEERAVQR
jgi:hypothetical protein